jgi:hypothetical protein
VSAQAGDNIGVVLGARAAVRNEEMMREAEFGCGVEAAGVGDVGDDYGDFYAGQTAFADGFSDGEEVGSAAGEQDAKSGWLDFRR